MDLSKEIVQFLNRDEINVTILHVVDPAHFYLRECQSLDMSKEVEKFGLMDKAMQEYYGVTPRELHEPNLYDVAVVFPEGCNKYYRARIQAILKDPGHRDNTACKHLKYEAYLLDYARQCDVKPDKVYPIAPEFLQVPFQAVEFHLEGIKPLSMLADHTLCLAYRPAQEWDFSAFDYVKRQFRDACGSKIKVSGYDDDNHLYGKMYFDTGCGFFCLNDTLTSDQYGYYDENAHSEVRPANTLSVNSCSVNQNLNAVEEKPQEQLFPVECPQLIKLSNVEQVASSSMESYPKDISPVVASTCDSPKRDSQFSVSENVDMTEPQICRSPTDSEALSWTSKMSMESSKSSKISSSDNESLSQDAMNPIQQREVAGSSCVGENSRADVIDKDKYFPSYLKTKMDFGDQSLFEKQGVPAICIPKASSLPSILSTEDAKFNDDIQNQLKHLKFKGPSCIQSVIWPAVFRGRSFIALSPAHSGKTVSYLLPLLSEVINRFIYFDLPEKSGPLVFVICSSWKKVLVVYKQANLLLGLCKSVSIQTSILHGTDKSTKSLLIKSCDILITTPSSLVSFLDKGITSMARCCHFILDDGNTILKFQFKEIQVIMRNLLDSLEKRKGHSFPFQIGICAEKWTDEVSNFSDSFIQHPLLCFTTFLETAVYAKLQMHVHMCTESTKGTCLLNLLGSSPGSKILIVCMTSEAAVEINSMLECHKVCSIMAHEDMKHYDHEDIKKKWLSPSTVESPNILILSDAALLNVIVTDVECLVHYDLPKKSRLQFSYRFGCFAEKFIDLAESKMTGCSCHILVTPECHLQSRSLVNLLQKVGTEIPEDLKLMASRQKGYFDSPDVSICNYFKSFGTCPLQNCNSRHTFFEEVDKPTIFPIMHGDVHAIVQQVFDAGHYRARIMRYRNPDSGVITSKKGAYSRFSEMMQDYYSVHENRVRLDHVEIGMVCCAVTTLFHRVEVINVLSVNSSKKVEILFIDGGFTLETTEDSLCVLAEQFLATPQFSAEVFICSLQPSDSSFEWSLESNDLVTSVMYGNEIYGKLEFCVGNTIFLNNIVVSRDDQFQQTREHAIPITKVLKRKGYACRNLQHLPLLYKEYGEFSNELATGSAKLGKLSKLIVGPTISSTYFDVTLERECVYVSHIISPDHFFVQKAQFARSLEAMNNRIMEGVVEGMFSHFSMLHEGVHCLALLPDDERYYRGKILRVFWKKGDDEMWADVLFVDFGDCYKVKQSRIYRLPKEFTELPFLAIECELAGVSPVGGEWTAPAMNILFNYTRNASWAMKRLQLMVWEQHLQYSSHPRYVVELFSGETNIGEELVIKKLAVVVEGPWTRSIKIVVPPAGNIPIFDDTNLSPDDNEDDLPPEDRDAAALMTGVLLMMRAEYNNESLLPAIREYQQQQAQMGQKH